MQRPSGARVSGGLRAHVRPVDQTRCVPRRRTEKALRCLRSSRRILSSSESGSRGLLYSSSSTSFSEASPPWAPWLGCVELGSEALFFLHLVRRFWNHTWRGGDELVKDPLHRLASNILHHQIFAWNCLISATRRRECWMVGHKCWSDLHYRSKSLRSPHFLQCLKIIQFIVSFHL